MPWALSNLYWEQNFLDYRFTVLAGLLDATDYTNVYALMDPWTDFFNLAFSNDLTIPIPDPGLGIALFAQFTDNLYILGSLVDANGDPTKPLENFNSFFGDAEYFSSIEAGWFKSLATGYSDNIHLTFWHAAERRHEGVPSGWGLAFSANRLLEERWSPFLRAGYAREGGAFWEQSVSLGCGYHVSEIINQLGLGLNWGRPAAPSSGSSKESHFTAEIYGRFNLWKVFALTPDIQLLLNPASDTGQDVVAVFGLRGRVGL
jgi:porin